MSRAKKKSVLWTIPNILTYFRILAVPAMAGCFFLEGEQANWYALLIFVVASITDFFDGYLARIWQQQSALGKMLDPIADKLIVSVALLMLVGSHAIEGWYIWAAIIILCREILVSGLREFLAELNVSVPVTWIAKWKTTIQMIAISFLLAGEPGDRVFPYTTDLGLFFLGLAAVITLYTGYDYFYTGLHHIIKEDEDEE